MSWKTGSSTTVLTGKWLAKEYHRPPAVGGFFAVVPFTGPLPLFEPAPPLVPAGSGTEIAACAGNGSMAPPGVRLGGCINFCKSDSVVFSSKLSRRLISVLFARLRFTWETLDGWVLGRT